MNTLLEQLKSLGVELGKEKTELKQREKIDLPAMLGDHFGIKVRKGLLIPLPSFQDRCPAKTSLCAFQHKKFKMRPIIMHRYAPFKVMVLMELRILRPLASFFHIVIIVITL